MKYRPGRVVPCRPAGGRATLEAAVPCTTALGAHVVGAVCQEGVRGYELGEGVRVLQEGEQLTLTLP